MNNGAIGIPKSTDSPLPIGILLHQLPDDIIRRILGYLDFRSLRAILAVNNRHLHDCAVAFYEHIGDIVLHAFHACGPRVTIAAAANTPARGVCLPFGGNVHLDQMLRDFGVWRHCSRRIVTGGPNVAIASLFELLAQPLPLNRVDSQSCTTHIYALLDYLLDVCLPPEPNSLDCHNPSMAQRTGQLFRTFEQHVDQYRDDESLQLVQRWLSRAQCCRRSSVNVLSSPVRHWLRFAYRHSCIVKTAMQQIRRLEWCCDNGSYSHTWAALPQLRELRVRNVKRSDVMGLLNGVSHLSLDNLHLEGVQTMTGPHNQHVPQREMRRALRELRVWPMEQMPTRPLAIRSLSVVNCPFMTDSDVLMIALMESMCFLCSLCIDGREEDFIWPYVLALWFACWHWFRTEGWVCSLLFVCLCWFCGLLLNTCWKQF